MCKINKRNKEKYANTNTKTAWIAFGIHFSFARAFDFPIFFSSIFFRAFGFNRRMILLCRHFTQRIASPPNKYCATYEMTIYSYFYVLMISYRVCGEVIWCIWIFKKKSHSLMTILISRFMTINKHIAHSSDVLAKYWRTQRTYTIIGWKRRFNQSMNDIQRQKSKELFRWKNIENIFHIFFNPKKKKTVTKMCK